MKRLRGSFSTLRWVGKSIGPARGSLAFLFFVKILQGVEGIVFAFGLRKVIDAAVDGDRTALRDGIWMLAALVVIAIVAYWCAIYYTEKPASKLGKALRAHVFSQLLRRSYADVSRVHSGEWMTRLNSDTVVVGKAVCTILPSLAGMIVQITCAFLSLFLILPRVAWMLIPCGMALIAVSLFLRVKLKAYHMMVQQKEGVVYSYLQEHLESMSVIRTYTKEETSEQEAAEKLNDLVDVRLKRARFTATCATAIYALVRIGYFIGVILCGTRLLNGVLTYGMMMAVLQLIRQAEAPLADVTHAVPQFFNMLASAERLMEIEKTPTDYDGNLHTPEEARAFYDAKLAAFGLRNVSFAYGADSEEVLSGRSFTIRKGEYVAFTGESGCGKSTTMSLMMGLYVPDSGEVFLQDSDGGEQSLSAEWRALFAYVPQKNLLLSGTIRDVVAFSEHAKETVGDEEIMEALRIACADGFTAELPDGLDTMLGERGSGLSEGQMQRIAIARAIFSKRPILMLDEATSALDEETEKTLLENLRTMTDRTVLIITHRPAALAICDNEIHFG